MMAIAVDVSGAIDPDGLPLTTAGMSTDRYFPAASARLALRLMIGSNARSPRLRRVRCTGSSAG
ncbi:MAG: hypothetical protein GC152_08645 [Alphaproteobacteria bacterium]|nr:hypothetical protein [Alphaproteobacteria bacterium]